MNTIGVIYSLCPSEQSNLFCSNGHKFDRETTRCPICNNFLQTIDPEISSRYLSEFVLSSRSLKTILPDIPITVFVNEKARDDLCEYKETTYHDNLIHLSDTVYRSYLSKIVAMKSSPYDRTFFLDSDTYVNNNIIEIYDILRDTDLALPREISWEPYFTSPRPGWWLTGTAAFRRCHKVEKFFDKWIHLWEKGQFQFDEPALNQLIPSADLSLFELDKRIWNAQDFEWFPMKENGIWDQVKIIHSHRLYKIISEFGIENLPKYSRKKYH